MEGEPPKKKVKVPQNSIVSKSVTNELEDILQAIESPGSYRFGCNLDGGVYSFKGDYCCGGRFEGACLPCIEYTVGEGMMPIPLLDDYAKGLLQVPNIYFHYLK
jgi:hypothetical protein